MNWQIRILLVLLTASVISCQEGEEGLKRKAEQELINSFPKVELFINEHNFEKIETKREEALKKGVLECGSRDLVDAVIVIDSDSFACKTRLKGDWTTHLRSDKWSFRVELKSGRQWNRMNKFSLQNPKARDFLSEWVWHKMMEEQGLLTTQYAFCSFSVNGEHKGVYAFEEHFSKLMLWKRNLPIGIIMKMEEDELWADRVKDKKETEGVSYFAGSEIDDFRGFKSIEEYDAQRQKAINLVHDYKFVMSASTQIFNADFLVKYLALVDLHRAYHTLFWHNQRFYFDLQSQKLELIGYDGFTEAGAWPATKKPFIGQDFWRDNYLIGYKPYLGNLFNNKTVFAAYLQQLRKISSNAYLNIFLTKNSEELNRIEQFIQTEYQDYNYDYSYLPESAKRITEALEEVDKKMVNNVPHSFPNSKRLLPKSELLPMENISVKAYLFSDSVRVFNFYHQPISISNLNNNQLVAFENKIEAYIYSTSAPPQKDFLLQARKKWLYYTISGIDSVFKTKIQNQLPPNYELK